MTENKVEVIIGGSIYSLKGGESQEHIQKVAALIDRKILELQKSNIKTSLNTSKLYMLAAINVADEYIKLKKEYESYEQELLQCNMENLALKQRLEEISLELTQAKIQGPDKTVINNSVQKVDEDKNKDKEIDQQKDIDKEKNQEKEKEKENLDGKKPSINSIKNNIKKNNESSNRGR